MKKIMMIAGEPSGDLHGSNLILALKNLSPDIDVFGTGGERMRAAGARLVFDLRDLAVTGLFDVIKNLARLIKIQRTLLSEISAERPDLLILIDYPDFNLRFAKKAKALGVPIVYYIGPQVWAWRKGRIRLLKKYIDKMIVIFRFEEDLYKKEGMPVEFFGHPLLDIVKPSLTRAEFLKVPQPRGEWPSPENRIVALMPGSRKGLVKRHLPIMLEAAALIYQRFPESYFLISKSPALNVAIYRQAIESLDLPVTVVENDTYNVLNAADFVITISGTITLETAIMGKPMAIIYRLPWLEYLIARPLLRLKNIGLANIVAGKEIAPEFIQSRARADLIAADVIDLLEDPKRYEVMKEALARAATSLLPAGAAKGAAASIIRWLQR
ncbi:MAG: lipid-A-disaccharide synthase [Candidatus Omnitrophota bacterium]